MGQMGVFDRVVKNHIFMGRGGRKEGSAMQGIRRAIVLLPPGGIM